MAVGAGSRCPSPLEPGFPALGARHHDPWVLPRIKSTLGGEESPFRIYGDSGRERLDKLVALNTRLTQAYLLKEDFRGIYQTARTPRDAELRLRDWVASAVASGLQRIGLFAKILLNAKDAFTAYFKHRITSGPIEAFNNQIARFIHRSCGITNLDYLFLKMRAQSLQQN